MKILIIATPRSGSTALTNALAKLLKCRKYHEPYNYMHPSLASQRYPEELPDPVVVKTIFIQLPKHLEKGITNSINFYQKEIKKFDRVILLSRKDIKAAYESFNYRAKSDPLGSWHSPYSYIETEFDKKLFNDYLKWTSSLIKFGEDNNLDVTWYEDLYSNNIEILQGIVDNLKLGFNAEQFQTELNYTPKYRVDTSKQVLI